LEVATQECWAEALQYPSQAGFDISITFKKKQKLVEIFVGGLTCKDDECCGYDPSHLENLMVKRKV
jgi:hypothetical protein